MTSHTVTGNALPAVTDLHRCDLTKEQRDEHIRRYAELLQKQRDVQSGQVVQIESKRADGRGHRQKETAAIIAEETGLSQRTVERVLNPPMPKPKVVDIKSALDPESDHDAIIREANAIVSRSGRFDNCLRKAYGVPVTSQFACWCLRDYRAPGLKQDALNARLACHRNCIRRHDFCHNSC